MGIKTSIRHAPNRKEYERLVADYTKRGFKRAPLTSPLGPKQYWIREIGNEVGKKHCGGWEFEELKEEDS